MYLEVEVITWIQKNTYKNEEGDNDVILLGSVLQEEIENEKKERRIKENSRKANRNAE